MGLLDDIRGLLTPKPAVVPNPFDRQANAAIPIMGASEILPNMVGRMTGSPMAEFAAGFLSPSSWIKQPKKLDIFVGKKGIKNLGLDDVLEKARQMEKAGKSRDEIWEATAQMAAKKGVPGGGIGRGVDKQWRFEISDKYDIIDSPQGAKEIGAHWKSGKDKHLSSLYEGGSPSITQYMAMSHDDLFKAYPELRATNLTGGADKSRGSFSGDTVTMRWDDIARASNPQKVEDLSEPMSTNLHELQHAIQQREGLARGGSPDLFDAGPMFSGKANELASDLSQNLTGGLSAKPQEIVAAVKYGDPKELAAIAQKHGFGSIDDALKFLSAEDVKRTPFGQYQRLAGEAEARLTQSRMNMTPLDRQMFPPWSQKELGGYDVPEAQQIVRFGDGPAMNAPMRPSNASVGMSSKPKGWVSGWETRIDQPYLEGPPAPKRPLDTWGGYGTPEEYQAAQAAKQIADAEWAARTSQAQRNIRYGASRSPYAGGQSDKVYDRIAQDVPPYLNDRPRNHLGQEIPPTPYELAHAEAQRVAALPVEQGGLGLPEGNTAMERARAMGFDTDGLHGTGSRFSEVNTKGKRYAEPFWLTYGDGYIQKEFANNFADMRYQGNPNIIPVKVKKPLDTRVRQDADYVKSAIGDWPQYDDIINDEGLLKWGRFNDYSTELQNKGIESVLIKERPNMNSVAVLDPRAVRSRFAAFNPAKRDSADLLAGLAPWAMPVGATLLGGAFLLPPEEY